MSVIRAHSVSEVTPLALLTLNEAARELRCSKTHLYKVLRGGIEGVPPLPIFHIGRKAFIRSPQLRAWIRSLEDMERESQYTTGHFGLKDEDLEYFAGA